MSENKPHFRIFMSKIQLDFEILAFLFNIQDFNYIQIQYSVLEVFLFCSWVLALSLKVKLNDFMWAKKVLRLSSLYLMHMSLTF